MTNWLLTPDGRRAAAFAALMGASIVMTLFAAIGVYLVSGNAAYSFWLAMAAHAQILLCLTALGALLVKRTLKVGREGIEVSDQADAGVTTATATVEMKSK